MQRVAVRVVVLIASIPPLHGCDNPTPRSPAFTFEVYVPLSSGVTDVTADGEPQELLPVGAGLLLDFKKDFSSYAEAMASPPISFELITNGTTSNVGQAAPGACAAVCTIAPPCPVTKDIIFERQDFPQGDFTVAGYGCVYCSSKDENSVTCP